MSAVPQASQPVRRGALDATHTRLGVRWRSEHVRWPESYGDPDGERRVTDRGVGLAEVGPLDKLVVRGDQTMAALARAGLAEVVGAVALAGDVEIWGLGDDEAILLLPAAAGPTNEVALGIAANLRAAGAAVSDVSSGVTVLRLVGLTARRLLEDACPIDLAAESAPDLGIVQATIANVRVILARQDQGSRPGFTILASRDEAEYLWDALVGLGAAHGLTPIGGAAVRL